MTRFWFWLTHNASSTHHRWMQRYLQRQGWVVFYLDERDRNCRMDCWLWLSEQERKTQIGER